MADKAQDRRGKRWAFGTGQVLAAAAPVAGVVLGLMAADGLLRIRQCALHLGRCKTTDQYRATMACIGYSLLIVVLAGGASGLVWALLAGAVSLESVAFGWRGAAILVGISGGGSYWLRVRGNHAKERADLGPRMRPDTTTAQAADGVDLLRMFQPVREGAPVTVAMRLSMRVLVANLVLVMALGQPYSPAYGYLRGLLTKEPVEFAAGEPAGATEKAADNGSGTALEGDAAPGSGSPGQERGSGFGDTATGGTGAQESGDLPPEEDAASWPCGLLEDVWELFRAGPVPDDAGQAMFDDWAERGGEAAGCPKGSPFFLENQWVVTLEKVELVANKDGSVTRVVYNAMVVSDAKGNGAVVPADAATVLRATLPRVVRVHDRVDFNGGRYLAVILRAEGCGLFVRAFDRSPYRWFPPDVANHAVPYALSMGGVPYLAAEPERTQEGLRYLVGVVGLSYDPEPVEIVATDSPSPRVLRFQGHAVHAAEDWCRGRGLQALRNTAEAAGEP